MARRWIVFFSCEAIKENKTYSDLAVRLDREVQKCEDCGLEIPDPIKIWQFFQAAGMTADECETVLMATDYRYDWKELKEQLDKLYPQSTKKKYPSGRNLSSSKQRQSLANDVGHGSGDDPLEKSIKLMIEQEAESSKKSLLEEALDHYVHQGACS